jgi:HEAT repeat protein
MDVRREAARSLGLLGDERAIPSLRGIEGVSDALLSRIAFESLVKLNAASPTSPVPPSR